MGVYDNIIDIIKDIDTSELSDDVSNLPSTTIIDEQKTYFWIRLFIKEEELNIEEGDDVVINWIPNGEELITKFVSFGKTGLDSDQGDQLKYYESEDDKKVLCLMIDEKMINYNDSIPFIRTLFKNSIHYEYQLMRKGDLTFTNKRNNIIFDYYECDF